MRHNHKQTEVARHFDAVAARYDLMNTILSCGLHHLWKRRTVGLLELKPGERVLDVCGGTGDLAVLAAREVGARGTVLIYDINRAMLLAGRPKVAQAGPAGRFWFLEGDAERLAITDDSVDAAMVGHVGKTELAAVGLGGLMVWSLYSFFLGLANSINTFVAQNYGASRLKLFTRVVVPGSLPLILTGARLALNVALLVTIAVELVAAQEGLGEMIWFAWETLRTEELYASLIVIAALGIGLNFLLQRLTAWLVPWQVEREA